MERSDFIELLSNFTFWIYFHDEKHSEGRIFLNLNSGSWIFDESKDYWNFLIQINSHHTDYVIENWYKNDYKEFLEFHLKEYVSQNDLTNLSSISQLECLDMINQEVVQLDRIYKGFYLKTFVDEDNAGTHYELLWHRNICFEIADDEKEKHYKENGDRFFNMQISSYLNKQKEVIEFAINLLNKKIQLLEFKQEKEANPDNLKSLEEDFERISKILSSLSTASKIKYFSFDRDNKKLKDENSDYMRSVLAENKIIEDVNYREFRRLFNNQILLQPIVWIGGEPLLHYFIKTLVEKKAIIDHKNIWKITSTWFVIKEEDRIRRIDPKRISRLKRPKKGVDFNKFDKVFSFIIP